MLVVFDLVFPKTLSPLQREMMRAAFFFPGKNPSKEAPTAATAFLLAANDGVSGWCTGGQESPARCAKCAVRDANGI